MLLYLFFVGFLPVGLLSPGNDAGGGPRTRSVGRNGGKAASTSTITSPGGLGTNALALVWPLTFQSESEVERWW